jgi:Concanavalin A-like lectin/glucanases superfamily
MSNKTLLSKEWDGDRRSPKFDFGRDDELVGGWNYPTLNFPSVFPIDAKSFYPFDQFGTLNDFLGYKNLSSPGAYNSTTNGVQGVTNYCIQLASPSHYVALLRLRSASTTSFSLNMWVRVSGTLLNGYIAGDQSVVGATGGSLSVRLVNDVINLNLVRFSTSSTSSVNLVVPASFFLGDNEWHAITLVYDESSNIVSLYVDAVLALTHTIPSGFVLNNSPLSFAFGRSLSDTCVPGMFYDDIGIWYRPLTLSEIRRYVLIPPAIATAV